MQNLQRRRWDIDSVRERPRYAMCQNVFASEADTATDNPIAFVVVDAPFPYPATRPERRMKRTILLDFLPKTFSERAGVRHGVESTR